MALDVMFVNGLLFLLMVSSKLKFLTAEFLENMKINNIYECYKTVIKLYNSRGFIIKHLLGDPQFDGMKQWLYNYYNIIYKGAAADKHIPKVETIIWVVKERVCASISHFPWKEATPQLIVKEIVKYCITMINSFPPKSGIETHLSPCNIVTGKTLDYQRDFKIPFGDYIQVHKNEELRNNMAEKLSEPFA